MVAKKPQRRNYNASKTGDSIKTAAPIAPANTLINEIPSGSRFAVLVYENVNDNDSDEIVPATIPSPTIVNSDKAPNTVPLRDIDRAQLKQGLQATMSFSNKNSSKKISKYTYQAIPSHATTSLVPKIATTEKAIMTSPCASLSPSAATPLPRNQTRLPAPPFSASQDPINPASDTPYSEPHSYVQLSKDSDDVGIGVNGATREKDVSMEDIISQTEDLSDDILFESTDSAMHS